MKGKGRLLRRNLELFSWDQGGFRLVGETGVDPERVSRENQLKVKRQAEFEQRQPGLWPVKGVSDGVGTIRETGRGKTGRIAGAQA